MFPCCYFVLPEFSLAFRLVLRFPSLIVPDVGGASHFSLFIYTLFPPKSSSFLLVSSPSYGIHRLGYGPIKYSHSGLIYSRNFSELLFSSPCSPSTSPSPSPSPFPLPRRGRRGRPPTWVGGAEAEVGRSGEAEGAARRGPPLAPVRSHDVPNLVCLYNDSWCGHDSRLPGRA